MRSDKCAKRLYGEPAILKSEAIYDLAARLKEGRRKRLILDLSRENALLIRVLAETRDEIARLRKCSAN